MNRKTIIILLLLISFGLYGAGCGQDEREPAAGSGSAGGQGGGAGSPSQNVEIENAREVVIEANDQIRYNIESFTVSAGEPIRLVLKNVGSMPKFSMGHNVVILRKDVDATAFVEEAAMAAGNDYVPTNSEDRIVAATAMLGGGEEDSVTFVAPQETGDYVFLCSFPGHYQIGMRGVMTVE